MQGSILFPLNELKEIFPDVFAKAMKKYSWREKLLDQHIAPLDCLWNDVIHLSPVHPAKLKHAMQKAGRPMNFDWKFYEIDASLLDPTKTVVYIGSPSDMIETDFFAFDPNDLEKYSTVPEATKVYYKRIADRGERPLTFHLIPHILFRGSIDISH